jgi:hypothetical protein
MTGAFLAPPNLLDLVATRDHVEALERHAEVLLGVGVGGAEVSVGGVVVLVLLLRRLVAAGARRSGGG